MLGPLITIAVSVVLGAGLGVLPGTLPRIRGPLKTFAVIASAGVVALHFLPHTVEAKGGLGLTAAFASFGVMMLLQWFGRRSRRQGSSSSHDTVRNSALTMSYAALLLHRVGDGAAMANGEHGQSAMIALGAHAVPVIALVTMKSLRRSLPHALVGAVSLGLASLVGLLAVARLPAEFGSSLHGWVDALASGVLLHIVVHELPGAVPHTFRERGAEALAAGAGAVVVALPGGEQALLPPQIGAHVVEVGLHVAPPLCLTLLVAPLLQPNRQLTPPAPQTNTLVNAAREALGSLWLALRSHPSSLEAPRWTAAVNAPHRWLVRHSFEPFLSPEALVLCWLLLGEAVVAGQLLTIATAATALVFVARRRTQPLDPSPTPAIDNTTPQQPRKPTPAQRRMATALKQLTDGYLCFGSSLVWGTAIAGLAAALVVPGTVPNDNLSWLFAMSWAVTALLGPIAAIPLVAVLLEKGAPSGLAWGLCLFGWAVLPLRKADRQADGKQHDLTTLSRLTLGLSLAATGQLVHLPANFPTLPASTDAGIVAWLALGALGAVSLAQIWTHGVRGWLLAGLPYATSASPAR